MKLVEPLNIADGRTGVRHVFIHDLVLSVMIGVHRHEKKSKQRVCINLDLAVRERDASLNDDLENVVCYEEITEGVCKIIEQGHVNLVETLAENIAAMCLTDPRVRSARVRVEKLDILENAHSVGVEIERFNTQR